MLDLICRCGRMVLSLRYRICVDGLHTVPDGSDRRGILLLPTHPALIDPIILMSHLYPHFRCRVLGDQDQTARPVLRWLARRFGVIPLPDAAKYGAAARDGIHKSLAECGRLLAAGENVLLYPAGHILRACEERIGGNSAVEKMLRAAPGARVVLIRIRGLWGSSFSRAGGAYPDLARVVRKTLKALLLNGLFFLPRRQVNITLREPEDFPANGSRREINAYIEKFFNEQAPSAIHVPLSRLERAGRR